MVVACHQIRHKVSLRMSAIASAHRDDMSSDGLVADSRCGDECSMSLSKTSLITLSMLSESVRPSLTYQVVYERQSHNVGVAEGMAARAVVVCNHICSNAHGALEANMEIKDIPLLVW